MCAKSRLVLYPCSEHLPRGRTFRMGDALGDLFWEDEGGSRKRIASCRECAEGKPPYREDMSMDHFPLHRLPSLDNDGKTV